MVKAKAPLKNKPKRGRPTIESAIQRQKILTAAAELFVEEGYANTTLDAICAGAGVSKRAIYQYVGNKNDLFRAVCHEHLPLADHLSFQVLTDSSQVNEIVIAMARQLLSTTLSPDAIKFQRLLTVESARFPKLINTVVDEAMALINANIAAVIDALVKRGLIEPLDSARAADLFYDIIIGNRAFRCVMGHSEIMPDKIELDQRAAMFVDGHLSLANKNANSS